MDEWNGEERRKGGIETEHRLSVLETHLPILYEQLKEVKQEVRIEGAETREAIKEYTDTVCKKTDSLENGIKDLDTRLSVFERLKSNILFMAKHFAWLAPVSSLCSWMGYKVFHHGPAISRITEKIMGHGDKLK